jgi:serine phosphatase RsbU (regulator of sigma subunit)
MIGVGIHITERKLAEEAQRRSETGSSLPPQPGAPENAAGQAPEAIARAILQGARERAGGELRDDVAIVVIRWPGG